ncbi:transporter substrate-binding domain-containing protein [Thalassotalea sp. M1531]|uniref:Transporter substrate-binding domain-containing protein n=1 Tax=Thalassotalea algicola TaxID=2716224 RepID=A0A7Y0LBU6_9GAMM|nr:transporter substrate-binding domain-containing protein [Thalassotalea algicola]NMP31695.1 transporter substrate-binding domain-containing protein [Thalassotalea algicola]
MFKIFSLLIAISVLSLPAIAKPKKLIFAAIPQYIDRFESGQLEDNIVVRLAKELGVPIELYPCPWVRCLKLIETGQADIIDDLFKTRDREEFIQYLSPHFTVQKAGFRFYSLSKKIKSFADLDGLIIAHLRGYKHFEKFDQATNFTKVPVLDLEIMVNLMMSNRIDVFIAPPSFDIKHIEPFDPDEKIKKQEFDYIVDMPLYLGISKKSDWMNEQNFLEHSLNKVLSK